MSKASSKESALLFIREKCEEIIANPAQINNLNSVIEKFLQTDISSSSELYEKKLESFLEIAKLIAALVKKSIKTKNAAISNFVEQKAKLIIEIFISDELKRALENEEQFEIVAGTVSETIVLLNEVSPSTFLEKFVSNVIFQINTSETLNNKSLASLYQTFTKSSLIESLLEKISTELERNVINAENKKGLESLSTFFVNLPTFDLIQIENLTSQSKPEKSFEDEIVEEKPKQEFKRKFQSTFLKLLPLIESHKEIAIALYRKLDSKILSKMSNPLILSDYFLNKFKQDPEIQIEVLSCLFILVGKYGLEFENFYPQLEILIQQKKDGKSVYQMKNSKRFFKLVESALRSSKVPFKTIESMTKTIMNQILEEESEFAFWALAFFFNLTKKHRKLLDIIKEIPEFQLLNKHYNPRIRSLVNEFKKDLNKAEYLDIEKFSKIDCKKLTQRKVEELCQKLRQEDEAEFKIPGLFEDL